MTPREAAIITAYTGYLCGSVQGYDDYIKEKFGKFYSELEGDFESKKEMIKTAAEKDFFQICRELQKI